MHPHQWAECHTGAPGCCLTFPHHHYPLTGAAYLLSFPATVVIFEPQDRVNRQDQFARRIFRKGQRAETYSGSMLYNLESATKQRVLMNQVVKIPAFWTTIGHH
jgi:hypothetical protein